MRECENGVMGNGRMESWGNGVMGNGRMESWGNGVMGNGRMESWGNGGMKYSGNSQERIQTTNFLRFFIIERYK